jgi:hypothetical protein
MVAQRLAVFELIQLHSTLFGAVTVTIVAIPIEDRLHVSLERLEQRIRRRERHGQQRCGKKSGLRATRRENTGQGRKRGAWEQRHYGILYDKTNVASQRFTRKVFREHIRASRLRCAQLPIVLSHRTRFKIAPGFCC